MMLILVSLAQKHELVTQKHEDMAHIREDMGEKHEFSGLIRMFLS
jgi:hypothetical protein